MRIDPLVTEEVQDALDDGVNPGHYDGLPSVTPK